ncbi:MAG: S-layer family protein [Scytonematopsis contorta HA4267-MV1]|jgi:filamentous hemagglutinin family protein|nr:S-layer family protein [Scytonematopsis contorta HA4267-MV1]
MSKVFAFVKYPVFWCCFAVISPAWGQIVPDATLSVNSLVIKNDKVFLIDGGTVKGSNLFHSFERFDVPTGGEAFFNNISNIGNIFTRVTGGNVSNINGIVRANGNANLFLINPNGIIFGTNAKLDIGGSFIGTSASSIKFADGFQFTANSLQEKPLLTVSVPTGLQFGNNPGSITVNGTGHNYNASLPSAVTGNRGSSFLGVKPGNTLALIGGEVTLKGGTVQGEAGSIKLAGVGNQNQNAIVKLTPQNTGWEFDYSAIEKFAPVNLIQKALIDASGVNTGDIQLTGSKINVADGSWVLIENQGNQVGKNITVKASDSVNVFGKDTQNITDSRLLNYTKNSGNAGNILLESKQLFVQDGADIVNYTVASGKGGNILINALELLQLQGFDVGETPVGLESGIGAFSAGIGNAGKITILTNQLRLLPGSQISSATAGAGNGGDILIKADESVEILAATFSTTGRSTIFSSTFGSGNAGNIEINSSRLRLQDGGIISASTYASGKGGTITINAPESIEITGSRLDIERQKIGTEIIEIKNIFPSRINSSTLRPSIFVQKLYNIPSIPNGSTGSVILNTPKLNVSNGAELAVRNEGKGNGGFLQVNAQNILLDNSKFVATTESGDGGNINLSQVIDLQLFGQSQISSTTLGTGNGGNININTDTLVALENSDIMANAQNNRGGEVNIKAQGIFGTQYRDQITPKSDITATGGEPSLNGIVDINTVTNELKFEKVKLPETLPESSKKIAQGCSANRSNFIVTGRGGLSSSPRDLFTGSQALVNLVELVPTQLYQGNITNSVTESYEQEQEEMVEAQGWVIDANGKIALVTKIPNATSYNVGFSQVDCHSSSQP